jgi:Transcriptional regulatory protein, C terminal
MRIVPFGRCAQNNRCLKSASVAVPAKARASRPLEGEDLKTTHWEDARHWMSIYADLLEFKRGLLDRVRRDLANLQPEARKAAQVDLKIIDDQMQGYQARLDLWYKRIWDLQGLWLDPTGRMIRHKGHDVTLTKREFQLLQFLLNHPHRYFTTTQILGQAWADPALFPEEVRNYIRRLRKILVDLEIPVDIVNKPGRGYSLVLRGGPGTEPAGLVARQLPVKGSGQ